MPGGVGGLGSQSTPIGGDWNVRDIAAKDQQEGGFSGGGSGETAAVKGRQAGPSAATGAAGRAAAKRIEDALKAQEYRAILNGVVLLATLGKGPECDAGSATLAKAGKLGEFVQKLSVRERETYHTTPAGLPVRGGYTDLVEAVELNGSMQTKSVFARNADKRTMDPKKDAKASGQDVAREVELGLATKDAKLIERSLLDGFMIPLKSNLSQRKYEFMARKLNTMVKDLAAHGKLEELAKLLKKEQPEIYAKIDERIRKRGSPKSKELWRKHGGGPAPSKAPAPPAARAPLAPRAQAATPPPVQAQPADQGPAPAKR